MTAQHYELNFSELYPNYVNFSLGNLNRISKYYLYFIMKIVSVAHNTFTMLSSSLCLTLVSWKYVVKLSQPYYIINRKEMLVLVHIFYDLF